MTQPNKSENPHQHLTSAGAARALGLSEPRILKLCREGRLGYTLPKFGKQWVITSEEVEKYRKTGPLRAGRPKEESDETNSGPGDVT